MRHVANSATKPERKRLPRHTDVVGGRLIEKHFKETGCDDVNWIQLAQIVSRSRFCELRNKSLLCIN